MRRSHRQTPDLDITAFMNLMVILVPFLLITAVFNQITVLEMNLPKAADTVQPASTPPPLQLEVILRHDALQVGDKPGSLLKSFAKTGESYDLNGLTELLKQVKARFPEETAVIILLEPEVPYDNLVQVMDSVRLYEVEQGGKLIQAELFPDIALGDAPSSTGTR